MVLNNNEYFKNSFLKLERAKKHADELNKAIKEFQSESPYELIEHNANGRQTVAIRQTEVKQIKATPPIISLLLGDFLNNCRSSLEYLAIALVSANNGNIHCKKVQFPIAKEQSKFEDILCNQKQKEKNIGMTQVSDEFINKLIEGQFYENGKGSLIYGLSQLNNQDKHKMLIPGFSIANLANVKIGGLTIGKVYSKSPLKIVSFGEPTSTSQKVQYDVVFDIKIAGLECFSGQPLATVVDNILKDTHALLNSFKE